MNIMTVSRTHSDICDGFHETHFQSSAVFPLNPNLSRSVWRSEESNSDHFSEHKDKNTTKKDVGIQGK